MTAFENREEAGRLLAEQLKRYAGPDAVICALPRGGAPVAAPIAKALGAPLSILFVKKIAAPAHPEVAIGAIVDGDDPTLVRKDDVIAALNVSELYITTESDAALGEIERRKRLYEDFNPPIALKDKTVIIVDDGLATGASMEAAIEAAKAVNAKRVIAAIPVGPSETVARIGQAADELICLDTPSPFLSVSTSYDDFPQLEDAEVIKILIEAQTAANDDSEPPRVAKI